MCETHESQFFDDCSDTLSDMIWTQLNVLPKGLKWKWTECLNSSMFSMFSPEKVWNQNFETGLSSMKRYQTVNHQNGLGDSFESYAPSECETELNH